MISELLERTHYTLPVARFAHTFVPFTPELRPKSAHAPPDRRNRMPRLPMPRSLPRPPAAVAAKGFVPESPEIRPAAVGNSRLRTNVQRLLRTTDPEFALRLSLPPLGAGPGRTADAEDRRRRGYVANLPRRFDGGRAVSPWTGFFRRAAGHGRGIDGGGAPSLRSESAPQIRRGTGGIAVDGFLPRGRRAWPGDRRRRGSVAT